MAKKNLNQMNNPIADKVILDNKTNGAINSIIGAVEEEPVKKVGRKRTEDIVRERGSQQGLKTTETRGTFVISVNTLSAIKCYAYAEGMPIKEAVQGILEPFLTKYIRDLHREAGHGNGKAEYKLDRYNKKMKSL